jgi:hypothetical protein
MGKEIKPLETELEEMIEESDIEDLSFALTTIRDKEKISAQVEKLTLGCDFQTFWSAYPRKVGKKIAERKWSKMSASERDAALRGVKLWKQTYQWQQAGGLYIPYASTFLNQERWKDEPWAGAFSEPKDSIGE